MIVVFGGTGMLGQHTAKELIDKGETVVVTGVRRQEPVLLKEAIAHKQAIVEHLDLGDPFAVMAVVAKYKPDVVVDTSGYAPKQLAPAAKEARVALKPAPHRRWAAGRRRVLKAERRPLTAEPRPLTAGRRPLMAEPRLPSRELGWAVTARRTASSAAVGQPRT